MMRHKQQGLTKGGLSKKKRKKEPLHLVTHDHKKRELKKTISLLHKNSGRFLRYQRRGEKIQGQMKNFLVIGASASPTTLLGASIEEEEKRGSRGGRDFKTRGGEKD